MTPFNGADLLRSHRGSWLSAVAQWLNTCLITLGQGFETNYHYLHQERGNGKRTLSSLGINYNCNSVCKIKL
jgi:hypothetical protein